MPAGAEDTLQRIVDALAARLGRSVTIDDPALRLLAASRHFGDQDAVRVTSLLDREMPGANRAYVFAQGVARWTGPGRMAASAEFGAKARVCVPVRHRGLLLGYLWLIDPDETLDDEGLAAAQESADQAALLLHALLLRRDGDRGRDEALLRGLVSQDPATRARAEVSVREARRLPYQAPLAVVVVEPRAAAGDPEAAALDLLLALDSALPPVDRDSTLHRVDGHRLVVLVGHAAAGGARSPAALARRVVDAAPGPVGSSAGWVAGVGSSVDVGDAHASYVHAGMAIRAARMLPGRGDVVRWDQLGVYALLLPLLPEDAAVPLPEAVAGLLSADPSGRLLETVESYLDHAGDAQACATDLHIHRTTLYYRLRRLEELAAVDLSRGEDRLTVHLGIKLARLAGHLSKAEPGSSS